MTSDIIDNHDVKNYFSGKVKTLGDKFMLGCLVLPNNPELQIVIDICERDIDDGTYTLNSVKINGPRKLGFFKISKMNDIIEKNLEDSYGLHKTEDKLEKVKDKLEKEIIEIKKGED